MCGCLIAHTHRAPSLICIFSLAAICLPCLMQLFDLLTQIALQIMLDNLQVMQLHVCPSVRPSVRLSRSPSCALARRLLGIICTCRSARCCCAFFLGAWHTFCCGPKQFEITIMLTLFNLFSIESKMRKLFIEIAKQQQLLGCCAYVSVDWIERGISAADEVERTMCLCIAIMIMNDALHMLISHYKRSN